MWPLLRSARYLSQYRHITAVLSRHGLGWLADQAGLTRLLRWPRRLFRRVPVPPPPLPTLAQRLCLALEELGPTYVLMGHYLSTRLDLLPAEFCQALSCLPEQGPALPFAEVSRVVAAELGQPLEEAFAWFSPEPWRVTWLEQQHLARTPGGGEVWVSVPNDAVRARVEQDRPLLLELARLVGRRRRPELRQQISAVVQQFEETLRQWLDGREQGRNAERWQHSLSSPRGPFFGRVDWERTTAGLLTWQGTPCRPLEEAAAADPQRAAELVRAMYRLFGQAIFEEGFYPALPALGAPVVLEDGRLALAALAPAGYLGSAVRQALLRMLERFAMGDVEGIISSGIAVGLFERRQVSLGTHRGVRHMIERYYGLPLSELSLQDLARDLYALADRGVLHLPEELSLLLRTLAAVERWGQRLAPRVPPLETMAPLIRRAIAAEHSWAARQERLMRAGRSWMEALQSFPGAFRQVLAQAREGNLLLGLEPRGWEAPMRRLGWMVHRLVMSALTAGLLISLALIATALLPGPWPAWGWIVVGLSLSTMGILGVVLLLSFLRRED